MAVQHKDIADPEVHEPKGSSSASVGQVIVSNGDGTTQFATPSELNLVAIGPTLSASSLITQNPTGLDTPKQITFGDPISNTDIDIDVDGNITVLNQGVYFLTFNFNFGRANNTGTCQLAARLLLNDAPFGFTQGVKLTANSNIRPTQFNLFVKLNEGDVIKAQFGRDGSGADDGGLYTLNPTGLSWALTPSAWVRISKLAGAF